MIGDRCVVLEGARIEDGAQLAPGTVVPPGRLIPTKQLWGGNPCTFIKDLDVAETWSNYSMSYVNQYLGDVHKSEFTLWNSAYLDRDSFAEDLDVSDYEIREKKVATMDSNLIKYYA